MNATWMIFGLGFLAQILFFARMMVQWVLSERAKEVLSPVIFWQISLLASILMIIYGFLRYDFAIILGQFLTYIIYIRNLQLKDAWQRLPQIVKVGAYALPVIGLAYTAQDYHSLFEKIIYNKDISTTLMVWGVVAQLIFTSRFIYQWVYSEKRKISSLPAGFWIISLIGASMTFIYAVFRKDPVLLLGNLGGSVVYIRNLWIIYRYQQRKEA